ncbi:MAG: hypothetical protein WD342_09065 [Verrucomicrobiales bacterium]
MKSPYLLHAGHFLPLAFVVALTLGLTSCSENEETAEAEEAVDQLQTASDKAIDKAEEAVDRINESDANSSEQAEQVTEALREETKAAAATVDARAEEAESLIRETVDESETAPETTPAPSGTQRPAAPE